MSVKPLIYLFTILAMGATLGCAKKEPIKKQAPVTKVITIHTRNQPQALDPRKAKTLNDIHCVGVLQEGLFRMGKDESAHFALAKGMTYSEDKNLITLTLNECYWSNHERITAHDFVHAWSTALAPRFDAPHVSLLFVIKNAKAIKEGKIPSSFLGARAVSDSILEIRLDHQVPYLSKLLTHPIFFPVPIKVDQANSEWALSSSTYISSGPFLLAKWQRHEYLIAEKNHAYWREKTIKLEIIKMIMEKDDTEYKLLLSDDISSILEAFLYHVEEN